MRRHVVFLCVSIALLWSSVGLTNPVSLRDTLPPETLGYLRVPAPLGLLGSPKGSALDTALASEANQTALSALRGALDNRLSEIPDAQMQILLGWLLKLRAPLELALLNPSDGPMLAVWTQLAAEDTGDFFAQLETLLEAAPDVGLANADPDTGTATLMTPAGPAYLQLDLSSALLRLHAGPGATPPAPQAPAPQSLANDHPMLSFEQAIDASGEGLFLWLNGPAMMPLVEPQMDEETRGILGILGMNPLGQAALGYGVAGGRGRFSVMLDLPQAGMLGFIPRVQTQLELQSIGEPGLVLLLSLPLSEMLRQGEALLATQGGEDFTEYRAFRSDIEAAIGMSLEQALNSIGPELVAFSDTAGDYFAIRVNDRERLNALLQTLQEKTSARYQIHDYQGQPLHQLRFPGQITNRLEDWQPSQQFFWIDEGDYLFLSQLPQPLMDRLATTDARVSVDTWLRESQGQQPDEALLLISTRLEHIPRIAYYAYLQVLQVLSDLAGAEVDLLTFPSATELALPSSGGYGLQVDLGERLAVSFTFQNNPLEILTRPGGLGSIAVVGILAAVAIPAYVEYVEAAGGP